MDRTYRLGISAFDIPNGELTYQCGCGSLIKIRVSNLVPDQFIDYHGCGDGDISFPLDQVANYRKEFGLPQLGE